MKIKLDFYFRRCIIVVLQEIMSHLLNINMEDSSYLNLRVMKMYYFFSIENQSMNLMIVNNYNSQHIVNNDNVNNDRNFYHNLNDKILYRDPE